MNALVAGELLKLRTTRTAPLTLLAAVLSTAVALAWNVWQATIYLQPFDRFLGQAIQRPRSEIPASAVAALRQTWEQNSDSTRVAVRLMTSGQFLGLLLICVLATMLIAGEYHNRTITNTFLAAPRRARELAAKLVAATVAATGFWLASAVIAVPVAIVFLDGRSVLADLAGWQLLTTVLLNLGAYVAWALLGVGVGAMLRRQTAAAVAVTVVYLVGTAGVALGVQLLYEFVLTEDWVLALPALLPSIASQIMTTPGEYFPGAPPQWAGGVILAAYALALLALGARVLDRSDVT